VILFLGFFGILKHCNCLYSNFWSIQSIFAE